MMDKTITWKSSFVDYSKFLHFTDTTKTDTDGYKSCSKKEFTALIKQRDLIEYTKSGGHYYGTSYESVRELIVNGKICLLDVHPQVHV